MANKEYRYQELFPTASEDKTEYYLLTDQYVHTTEFEGKKIVKVDYEGLRLMAKQAFHDANFYLRPEHQAMLGKILDDPEVSDNDRYVALTLLRNAEVSAKGQLPFCQDTGTAIVVGKKGAQVWTDFNDDEAIQNGIFDTYQEDDLRYSQNAPKSMYEEVNTGTNLPAQVDLFHVQGDEYKFLCVVKGGGSANKTFFFPQTKTVLDPVNLPKFIKEKFKMFGTAACPPYHIAVVIGGMSPELNLKTLKLASAKYYDNLPDHGNELGHAFRDKELEKELWAYTREMGLGAQFGGKAYAHDVRVVRLPRHGASVFISIGVSCSADRNIKAKINEKGIWLEKLETNPARHIPEKYREGLEGQTVKVDLDRPMDEILKQLSQYPVSTRLSLSGTIIVARDFAHAKLKDRLDNGEGLPEYFKEHPVYYAGPAKTPKGMASGSFGPTTASRMDPYVDLFQENGGSMIMIAKGNRSQAVTDACKKHGGFYLGSIGGPAAILAQNSIKKVELLEYPELGMEAIWKIRVEDFPAFILVDDKGNDFFHGLL